MKKFRIVVLTAALVVVVLGAWAVWIEPVSFRIREESISLTEWPDQCQGLRIAVLADLHIGSPYKGLKSLKNLVADVNAANPDLILLPGDFVIQGVVGGSFVAPEEFAKVLADLRAPMGVYAVLGNHDWWLDAERVKSALESNAITVLEDQSNKISQGNCRFTLVGISDFWEGPHDVQKALAGVDMSGALIAFTHNPDIFPELPKGIDLTIAGHTHGGQVYLPVIGRPIVPSDYGERFAIGHIVENGRHLYVSSGVGTSIIPVRFLVPPEVVILEVTIDSSNQRI